MNKKETNFRRRLLATFKVEAQEHLNNMSRELVLLEKMPPPDVQAGLLESIYRESHSLKGASRAVNMADIEAVCQSLEAVFAAWKQKRIAPSPELFDTVYRTLDIIRRFLSSLEGGKPPEKSQVSGLLQDLSLIGGQGGAEEQRSKGAEGQRSRGLTSPLLPSSSAPLLPASDTVRISTAKLGALLLEAEEMLSVKQAANQHTINLKDISAMVELLKKEWAQMYGSATGRMDRGTGTRLEALVDRTQTQINSMGNRLAALTKSSALFNKSLDRMVDNHLEDMKKAMMLPFSAMLESFPMLIRDIAHEQGKDVDFVVHGQEIEIDRRILEDIKDPLIHLVRNSIDHGIERPEKRVMHKKPARGTIKIDIAHIAGNKVELTISDDGAGIDIGRLKEAAVNNGILSQPEADSLNVEQAVSLIFKSGISTTPIITDISGRGLGLAIVQEKIERLNGSISVETGLDAGTTFGIILPLTVATFRGVMVKAGGQKFIIPTTSVERTVRVRNQEIRTVENRETISVDSQPVSFVRLNNVLEMPFKKAQGESSGSTTAVLLHAGGKRIAFGVDEILDEQEVLAKRLGKQLSRVRNVAGAAILGSGNAVPILNVSDMARSAVKKSSASAVSAAVIEETEKKSILVVEDSITSRILLKNILESAGYTVKTAVDGIDAITLLKTEEFDLVVSDIEMPRMNGFELTIKIRADKKLADIPVVLVTVLEARKDRERGIDVGANAYIVKSSFDQSNLLEVVGRLI